MTMLDRMRRHKDWLKWSLAIVVVAFILLYIPNFLRKPTLGTGVHDVVASVEGREITVDRFRRVYQQQMQAYRRAYGGNMDEKTAEAAGHRPADRPADDRGGGGAGGGRAAGHHGQRRGSARPDPRHAGVPGERSVHRRSALPPDAGDAESAADAQASSKSRCAAASRIAEAAGRAHRLDHGERQGSRRRVSSAATKRSSSRSCRSRPTSSARRSTATDAEISTHFEAHKNELQDSREAQGAGTRWSICRRSATRTQVSPQDVQRYYEDNQQQYSTPEQVRASHILLKTEGKDDAAVKKQAEDLLAKVKGGADFAELATKYLRGRSQQGRRAAISTSSARARWCRSSTRRRSR